ncbi:interleukin-12 subunit beta-like isoform 2-T2 [Morphnus guianensis]
MPAAGRHGWFSASFADPSFCPFAEELHPLQLQLEGLSDTSYLNFSIHFFIRDIVRPNPPQNLTVQQWGEQLHLSWAPPASWPLPKSYFALLYRLQYELPNGTQVTAGYPCPACPCACRPMSSLCSAHPAPAWALPSAQGCHWEQGLAGASAMAPSSLCCFSP